MVDSDKRESIADSGATFQMTSKSSCTLEEQETFRKRKDSLEIELANGGQPTRRKKLRCLATAWTCSLIFLNCWMSHTPCCSWENYVREMSVFSVCV